VGQFVAAGLIVLGLLRFFAGAGVSGLWLTFIGWFLYEAAGAAYTQTAMLSMLQDVRVGDVMTRDCANVDAATRLEAFVRHFMRTGQRCFIVQREGHPTGLITPADVRKVDRERWPEAPVAEAMRPLQELRTATPVTPAAQALEMMAREDLNQLPVVSNGNVVGMFSRAEVLRLLQTRAEFSM
jgi:signal-transduction protein with cAMP-binding, CBS, and nucleotidyltransferase domain